MSNTFSKSVCQKGHLVRQLKTPETMQGPLRDVYQAALGLGTANQLTNILRDVGEDITERNRIYVPTQELKEFGIAESEVSCSDQVCSISRAVI